MSSAREPRDDAPAATHCVHYGACGGCLVADHARIDKAAPLRAALIRAGFAEVPMAPLVAVAPGGRRRADLAVSRAADGAVTLGLHRARGRQVIDMTMCALLAPPILALLPALRGVLRGLNALRREGDVIVNLLDAGPDVLVRADGPFSVPDRARLADFARARGVPRISVASGTGAPEAIAIFASPIIRFAGVPVEPPPGAFLQATAAGEAAIVAAMRAGLPPGRKPRVIELHAGVGTLTFPLARHAPVAAFEGFAPAVAALERALRGGALGGRVSVERRDLVRRPLTVSELRGGATVVLNPPYAGAAAQMPNLATARVPRIVYVSCNPRTLGADAAILARGGYRVLNATPIDQFAYSDNLESVVVFSSESGGSDHGGKG